VCHILYLSMAAPHQKIQPKGRCPSVRQSERGKLKVLAKQGCISGCYKLIKFTQGLGRVKNLMFPAMLCTIFPL